MKLIAISLTLLALLIPSSAVAGAKQQTFQLRLSTDAIVSDGMKHGPKLTWRIYDRQGRQVAELGSGDDDHFRDSLNFVFQSSSPVGSDKTLAWELGRLEERDGSSLRKMPEADFTVIKYWMKDCQYCQDRDERSAKVLERVLKSYQNRAVNILNIEIDIQQRLEEVKKKGYIQR